MKHIFTSMALLIIFGKNCRIWDSENPRVISEKQMDPQRITVWCGFWAGGIIGPYFFENDAATVNGVQYRDNTVLSAEIG